MMDIKDRIIVALDIDSLEKAKCLVEDLAPHVRCFKIGLELITAIGAPTVIEFIHALGGRIFYDGKFDDIPNTVGAAARAIARLNVAMFNVHASAGIDAMAAAVANKGQSLVLAVTVLVIGRPITRPPADVGTPLEAVKRIIEEVASAV